MSQSVNSSFKSEENPKRTPETKLDTPTAVKPSKTQRIPALDFTKGALVLIMVLYHWINYFIGPQWGYYRYLRFLTPSFIFITGFMISNVYLSKYDAADFRLSKRLITRGLKLLAIFIALNEARVLVIPLLSTGTVVANLLDPKNILTVFVTGNFSSTAGKIVSFSILVPIAYLLMFSGALVLPYRFFRYTFHAVCSVFLLSIWALYSIGAQSQNLDLVTIGMLGALIGFVPIAKVNEFVRHPYLLAFAYVLYTIAITIWDVRYPLQIVGVCLSVMVIYLVGAADGESGRIRSEVVLLGKYSLFGYISQIAILQILSASARHLDLGITVLVISFPVAFALTIVSVEVVDRIRTASRRMDGLYKAVFS
jgi:peptidoglycan/LPS O-acetylase OafA/YrhL